jgi:hypothetical protein
MNTKKNDYQKIDSPFEEVEMEHGNDDVVISIPFDPNKIKVNTRPYTLGQIIDDLNFGIIDLDTEFQRLPNLWDDKKKSRFIESLMLKLPIPAFYFNEKEENDWEVVDGLQRISTLKQFVIDNNLILRDLEFLKDFDGCKYSNLPSTLQRRIKTFSITLYVIEKGTPDEVKYNIFKRINQGGLVLSPQEIRHAINQGIASDLVADLVRGVDNVSSKGNLRVRRNFDGTIIDLTSTSEGKVFVKATDNRISSARMEDRDFATRFIAFYLIDYKNYEPDLDTFLNKGMALVKTLTSKDIRKLKADYVRSLNAVYDIFKDDAFRKRFNLSDGRKPINKALFEVLSVTFAKLDELQISSVIKRKKIFIKKFIGLHNTTDGKFLRSISTGTAQRETVEQRFKDINQILLETLND